MIADGLPGRQNADAQTDNGFDLLRDFWVSIRDLQVEGLSTDRLDIEYVEKAVRAPMLRAFEIADYTVNSWEVDSLRRKARSTIETTAVCATLDRREYFDRADFAFDLTRTVSDISRTGSKFFLRRPRDRQNSMERQLKTLRGLHYRRSDSPVVLTDDGVSTGQMLAMVVQECAAVGINVERIVVCCNNTAFDVIEDIKIQSLIPRTVNRPWLNERDLYWGLPRSGLSLSPEPAGDRKAVVYGLPFTADASLLQQRVGIDFQTEQFRAANLKANATLWRHLEQVAGRPLYCEDCPPLRFVGDIMGRPATRVLDLIADASTTSLLQQYQSAPAK